MRNITALILLFSCMVLVSKAQWIAINPGAGGQVQDIVCDPNVNSRVILASDMEGIYESLDNGASWAIKGELHNNRVYAVTIPKQVNNQKMYVGTLFGLEVSSNGGNSFTLIQNTKKLSIGAIAVDPNNTNNVIAGIGWRDDYGQNAHFGLTDNGNGEIFRSTDAGVNWTKITFDSNSGTDRNVFTIQHDKNNSSIVYLGSAKGIFKSTNGGVSWSLISGPSSTYKNRGVSLSPDGKVLYASYTTSSSSVNANIYATLTSAINWKQVTTGTGIDIGSAQFWYPEVDPRSTSNSHKVLIAFENDRRGLYEGSFSWNYSNNTVTYGWAQAWQSTDVYDGWDIGVPNARVAHYTPDVNGWTKAIWSTTNQNMYRGVPNGSSYTFSNRYSFTNNQFPVSYYGIVDVPSYGSRGTQSTYTWDIDADANYVIQGQGDNGAMESWDGGVTWSDTWMRTHGFLSDVQAVDIAHYSEQLADGSFKTTPIVLAQMAAGFGGDAHTGNLYVKLLTTHSPSDEWEFYAGGSGWRGALPNGLFSDIAVSPVDKGQFYVYSRTNGLYTQNLYYGYNEQRNGRVPYFSKITNGVADAIYSVKKIAPHPTNKNIVFLSSVGGSATQEGVYKGVRTGNDPNNETSNWTWTKVYNGGGWDAEVDAWEYNGQVYLFYSGKSSQDGDGENFIGAISLDEGATWKTVLKSANTKAIVSHGWYTDVTTGSNNYNYKFQNKGGLVGYDNKVIMSHYDHDLQKAYAVLQGTISGSSTSNASVSWANFTDDIEFGGLTTAKVIQEGANRTLYVSTAGAGAWKRPLNGSGTTVMPSSVSLSGCPSSSKTAGSNFTLTATVLPANATNKSVTWSSSNTAVATVSGGIVSAVAGGTAVITVTTVSGSKTATCSVTVVATPSGCTASGSIRMEKYDGITGTSVSNLTSASIYPNSPSSTSSLTSLEIATNVGDNYGVRVSGYICAPANGSYTFWIAGDDAVELWLSTDATTSNKIKIASHTGWTNSREWNKYSTQKSAVISFVAGKSYYIEALMKEGYGGDNLAVGWRKPSDGTGSTPAEVIPGSVLSPATGGGTTTIPVTSVNIGGCITTMTVGNTATYTAIISPSNATNKSVTWTSSNSAVASVTSAGIVTAVAVGNATITVTTTSGSKTATCVIAVSTGGATTSYRYLRLTGLGTVGNDVTLQQIHWMVGSTSYPNPKLEWNTRMQVTTSNGVQGDGYGAFDNTNGGWSAGSSYPTWIVIDLGAGNAIAPDAIKIKPNASDRGFSAFECRGSNDNTNWTLLHTESGLTSSAYAGGLTTFSFGASAKGSTTARLASPLDEQLTLNVYPNPVSTGDAFFIQVPAVERVEMQIVSASGTIVHHRSYSTPKGAIEISGGTLNKAGLYLIRLSSGEKRWTQKLMVK